MPEYYNQSEFARKIGCSRQVVSKALKTGRIQYSDKLDEKGNKLIEWEVQSVAFLSNRDVQAIRGKRVSEQAKRPVKLTKKRKTSKKTDNKDVEKKEKKVEKALLKEAGEVIETIKEVSNVDNLDIRDGLPGVVQDRIKATMDISPPKGSIAYNANRKTAIDASRSELKFAKELGEVIPTEVAIGLAGSKIMATKEAILAMPSRTVGLLSAVVRSKVETFNEGGEESLYIDILNTLKGAVDDILAVLSANQDKLPESFGEYFENK